MTNICMIARNRPNLTQQAVQSLYDHTDPSTCTLTVLDDGTSSENLCAMYPFSGKWTQREVLIHIHPSKGIVGLARNLAIRASETYWGRGDFLCMLDNDVYLCDGWLEKITRALAWAEHWGYRILGGQRHPFHQIAEVNQEQGITVQKVDAVAGYSMLMRWETWDKYGPFPDNQPGVCCSEDWAVCQRITKELYYKVGYIHPPVLYHCGITNTLGQPAVGSEAFERVPGVLYE